MKLIANLVVTIGIIFLIDAFWINLIAGDFYADQLASIGRFSSDGAWNVRVVPGLLVYLCMALAVEFFVFRNGSVRGLRSSVIHGAFLGFLIYGVYDFTNRAILENYPTAMVVIDVIWGSALFTAVTYINFQLRQRLTFL